MLIPVATEAAEDFIVRARDTLALPGTHAYVDTSVTMWLTAVGPTSRAAFIAWSATLEDRIHVPAWAVQEYYRHHQSRTQVNGITEKCSAAEKALADLSAHMRVFADGPLVPGQPEMSFTKDLAAARERVASATRIARAWDYEAAAAEVIEWMNAHALSTTRAFKSFDRLKRRGSVRYGHEVPPGFEDRHKETNRFGDLLFWEDVVADARRREAAVAAVLTRDRKKDWFFAGMEADVGDELRQLKGTWPAVPVPHPMLSLEMRTRGEAELLLIDELYLGAVMWSTDKDRFGRLAAVTFGKSLDWLAAATAPPPGVPERATKRASGDTVSILPANGLIKSAKAPASAPVLEALVAIEGEAPQIEEAIAAFTPERLQAMPANDLASLARRTYDLALAGPSPAAALARRLLDQVDRVDAAHASAIVGGMLVAAYFDGAAVRDRPAGDLLQDVFEWRADPGISRTLTLLSNDLARSRSPALYLPSSASTPIEIRIDASESNTATPVAVGQLYVGQQAVLVDPSVDPALTLSTLLSGAEETTVADLVDAVARHYGVPVGLVQLADAAPEETRTILASTGVDRFDPYRLPARPAQSVKTPLAFAAAKTEAVEGDPGAMMVVQEGTADATAGSLARAADGDGSGLEAAAPSGGPVDAVTEPDGDGHDDEHEDEDELSEEDEEDLQ